MADPSETTRVSGGPALDETASASADPTDVLDAVRELSAQVGSLQSELHALRSQTPSLPAVGTDSPGWEEGPGRARSTPWWVRSLDSPAARRPPVPWLLLEIVFLAAVGVAAAVAELDAPVIVAVMAAAWALVALIEWTAARAARRQAEAAYAPLAALGTSFSSDPSWFAPPVERTILDNVADSDDTRAKLPAASED